MLYAHLDCHIKGRPISARLPARNYLFYHSVFSLLFKIDIDSCFTARSLRSLKTQSTLSFLFIVFSPERGENTMGQALPGRNYRHSVGKSKRSIF
jgi:hypothetical protein